MNEAKFNEAYELVLRIKQARSLALEDIMSELHKGVMATKYTDEVKMYLVSRMSEIEYRLAQGSNERVQVSSLVGSFIEVRTFKVK